MFWKVATVNFILIKNFAPYVVYFMTHLFPTAHLQNSRCGQCPMDHNFFYPPCVIILGWGLAVESFTAIIHTIYWNNFWVWSRTRYPNEGEKKKKNIYIYIYIYFFFLGHTIYWVVQLLWRVGRVTGNNDKFLLENILFKISKLTGSWNLCTKSFLKYFFFS